MNDTILLRRDTAANWAAANPVLLEGEEGLEIDTRQKKMGDGIHHWNDLDYNKLEGIADSTGNSHTLAISQDAATKAIEQVNESLSGDISNLDGKVDGINESLSGDISNLDGKVNALIAGAKLTLTNSWSVCYLRVPIGLRLVATMSGVTPSKISILDGNTELISAENQTSVIYQHEVALSGLTQAYRATALYNGGNFNANITLNARNPIFVGFGELASNVVNVEVNKISPKISAVGNYKKINNIGDNVNFFLLVPTDVTSPTSFTMGGAPFVMENIGQETFEVNGTNVVYNVFKSGAVYNEGAELDIVAA